MNINHQLKYILFDFLSNQTFSDYEFKDIRLAFIIYNPEYRSKMFYAKIYRIIRELVELKLILMDTSTGTYKYSSNYSKINLLDLITHQKSIEVENCLAVEYSRVIESISELCQELSIYRVYLNKFPMCSELISSFINKKESEIHLLKCELKALKSLLEAQ